MVLLAGALGFLSAVLGAPRVAGECMPLAFCGLTDLPMLLGWVAAAADLCHRRRK